jgi:hypothetical protein
MTLWLPMAWWSYHSLSRWVGTLARAGGVNFYSSVRVSSGPLVPEPAVLRLALVREAEL